jgi:hypothetical protein
VDAALVWIEAATSLLNHLVPLNLLWVMPRWPD